MMETGACACLHDGNCVYRNANEQLCDHNANLRKENRDLKSQLEELDERYKAVKNEVTKYIEDKFVDFMREHMDGEKITSEEYKVKSSELKEQQDDLSKMVNDGVDSINKVGGFMNFILEFVDKVVSEHSELSGDEQAKASENGHADVSGDD